MLRGLILKEKRGMPCEQVRWVALTVAGSLLLAGCYSFEPISVPVYQRNPNLLRNGDTVILYTRTEGALQGRISQPSAQEIVLRGGKIVPIDEIAAIQVKRFSVLKTIGLGLLVAAGVAAFVGIIWGLAFLFRTTA
jgi:hypothetical protein